MRSATSTTRSSPQCAREDSHERGAARLLICLLGLPGCMLLSYMQLMTTVRRTAMVCLTLKAKM